jgi:hypothetical membrane protein
MAAAIRRREAAVRFALHGGWVAAVLFVLALLLLAAATPGYRHAQHAVGFLGMHGAAHAAWWNLCGALLPGALLVAFTLALRVPLAASGAGSASRIGAWLLLLSALAFTGSGVFAFDPRAPGGLATQLHVAMLTLVLLGFLPGALLLGLDAGRRPGWHALRGWGLLLAAGTVAAMVQEGIGLVPALDGHPGALQRITLGLYLAWMALASRVARRAMAGVCALR